jgi:hypothetical protein
VIAMALVFQYGSNCAESQINSEDRLCGDARFIGLVQTVEDFELAFDVWSKNRNCAASDIVPHPGSKVWGALYEIPDYLIERPSARARGRKSLDEIEGEGTNYCRQTIAVCGADQKILNVLTYRVKSPKAGLKTSLEYAGHIVNGLRERGAGEEYIAHVKRLAIANNPELAASLDAM